MTQWALACRCTRKGQCARAAQPNQWLWSYEEDSRCLHIQSLLPAHHPRQEEGQVRLLYHLPVRDAPRLHPPPPHPPLLLPLLPFRYTLAPSPSASCPPTPQEALASSVFLAHAPGHLVCPPAAHPGYG